MESFLRRALHFFTHDRLLWIVHTTGSFINLQILPVLLVVGFWSVPLLFGVLYNQAPWFFSGQLAPLALLGLLCLGYVGMCIPIIMLLSISLAFLEMPMTFLLYWLLNPYRWIVLQLLLSWMRLSMFLGSRCRSLMWSIHDLRFAPSRYRISRYYAGYVDPYTALQRLIPTAIIAICGLPLPTLVVWHAYGPLEAILWASAICLVVATDLWGVMDRLNTRRDPI